MSTNKAKGTRFETEVVAVFQAAGFVHAERRAGNGVNDRGDITGVGPVVVECKNHRQLDLAGFMAEAEKEAANAKVDEWVVVAKRRMKSAAGAYAIVPLDQYAAMRAAIEGLTATEAAS